MKKQMTEILFWGSCWGLMEASLGYGVHFLAVPLPGLPGFLLFPLAFILMRMAMDSTGRKDIIIQMSFIAAGLKLLDFLVVGNDPIRIINPALSIIMEGCAVYAIIALSQTVSLSSSFIMGLLWRGAFLVYMVLISQFDLPAGLVTRGLNVALQFLLVESALNALIMSGYSQVDHLRFTIRPSWSLATSLCAVAVLFQWVT